MKRMRKKSLMLWLIALILVGSILADKTLNATDEISWNADDFVFAKLELREYKHEYLYNEYYGITYSDSPQDVVHYSVIGFSESGFLKLRQANFSKVIIPDTDKAGNKVTAVTGFAYKNFNAGKKVLDKDGKWIIYPEGVDNLLRGKEIVLPEGMEHIGERAFFNAKISKVNIPSSVRYIDYNAFFVTWFLEPKKDYHENGFEDLEHLSDFDYENHSASKLSALLQSAMAEATEFDIAGGDPIELNPGAFSNVQILKMKEISNRFPTYKIQDGEFNGEPVYWHGFNKTLIKVESQGFNQGIPVRRLAGNYFSSLLYGAFFQFIHPNTLDGIETAGWYPGTSKPAFFFKYGANHLQIEDLDVEVNPVVIEVKAEGIPESEAKVKIKPNTLWEFGIGWYINSQFGTDTGTLMRTQEELTLNYGLNSNRYLKRHFANLLSLSVKSLQVPGYELLEINGTPVTKEPVYLMAEDHQKEIGEVTDGNPVPYYKFGIHLKYKKLSSETPFQPEKPTEPEKPTVPEKPTEPEKPSEPEKPTDPEKPSDPDTPTEPEKPKLPETDIPEENPPMDVPFVPKEIDGEIEKEAVVEIVNEEGKVLGKAIIDTENNTYTFVDDDRVPQGKAKIRNDNVLEIMDDDIPESGLPKTDGISTAMFVIFGTGLMLSGNKIRHKMKRNKKK